MFEDSDIEYEILDDRKIKENIVIKKNNKDHYEYQYLISLENLTLKQNKETQELLFVDEKEKVIYSMLEPIMLDSNDSSSNDMNYDVKQLEENQYLLTIKADSNWINSEERVLPIYLDPTLQIQGASFARWYLIEKYRSVTEILTSGDFTAKINRDQIQVMEFDDTMLNGKRWDNNVYIFLVNC